MWLQNMLLFVKVCPENALLDSRWPKGTEEIFKTNQSHWGANPQFFNGKGRADSEPMYHFAWADLGWRANRLKMLIPCPQNSRFLITICEFGGLQPDS